VINIEGVFRVSIILILLLGISSSSAQEYKGDLTECRGKGSIDSEGYQDGKTLGKEKTSGPKFFLRGSGVGFVTYGASNFSWYCKFTQDAIRFERYGNARRSLQEGASEGARIPGRFSGGMEEGN
tara:strand:- start:31 stop:405 length:375 start_codon:yes stop_codon:yes gene_type:complete